MPKFTIPPRPHWKLSASARMAEKQITMPMSTRKEIIDVSFSYLGLPNNPCAPEDMESSLSAPMQLLLFHQDIRKIGLWRRAISPRSRALRWSNEDSESGAESQCNATVGEAR